MMLTRTSSTLVLATLWIITVSNMSLTLHLAIILFLVGCSVSNLYVVFRVPAFFHSCLFSTVLSVWVRFLQLKLWVTLLLFFCQG